MNMKEKTNDVIATDDFGTKKFLLIKNENDTFNKVLTIITLCIWIYVGFMQHIILQKQNAVLDAVSNTQKLQLDVFDLQQKLLIDQYTDWYDDDEQICR